MLLAAAGARAQTGRVYRIGCLFIAEKPLVRPFHAAFVDGMREHGYVAGRNLQIEVRYAGSDRARLETLADELVASSCWSKCRRSWRASAC